MLVAMKAITRPMVELPLAPAGELEDEAIGLVYKSYLGTHPIGNRRHAA